MKKIENNYIDCPGKKALVICSDCFQNYFLQKMFNALLTFILLAID